MRKCLLLLFLFSYTLNGSISVSGKIKDKVNNNPILFAEVRLLNKSNEVIDSALSDNNGNWQINFTPTSVTEKATSPNSFRINQNYPNPFNPSTNIGFQILNEGDVELIVHDILGQVVETKSFFLNPGFYSIDWYGGGSAGIYFYSIIHEGQSVTKKMVQLDGSISGGFSNLKAGNSNAESSVQKVTEDNYKIISTNFGYDPDTIITDLTFNRYFEIELETIHSKLTLVDLHNDVLEKMLDDPSYHLIDLHDHNHTDIPRMQLGGVDVELFVVWVSPSRFQGKYFETAMEMSEIFQSELNANTETMQQAFDFESTISVLESNKIAGIMCVEGGHSIENSIDNLITLYNAGMRYLTITWNNSTDWAVSAQDTRSSTVGLSNFGRDVIRTMDSLGVLIDVSHTGIKTIQDILETTTNPIIASHSGVRSLQNHYRNLYDDQIIAIANSGGVIGVVFYPPFLGSPSSSVNIDVVIKHINYIVDLVGIDHVSLGSDFDGIGTNTVNGLEDISKYPALTSALLKEGYSRAELAKILGENFLRVFNQVAKP